VPRHALNKCLWLPFVTQGGRIRFQRKGRITQCVHTSWTQAIHHKLHALRSRAAALCVVDITPATTNASKIRHQTCKQRRNQRRVRTRRIVCIQSDQEQANEARKPGSRQAGHVNHQKRSGTLHNNATTTHNTQQRNTTQQEEVRRRESKRTKQASTRARRRTIDRQCD